MESMLSTLAFALLIGGQFLAAIFVSSRRQSIYNRPDDTVGVDRSVSMQTAEKVSETDLPAKAA